MVDSIQSAYYYFRPVVIATVDNLMVCMVMTRVVAPAGQHAEEVALRHVVVHGGTSSMMSVVCPYTRCFKCY